MLNFITISIIITTMLVVIAGFIIMIHGGKLNQKYGNKMMVTRISMQAVALFLLFLIAN